MAGFEEQERAGAAGEVQRVQQSHSPGRLLTVKILVLLAFLAAALRLIQIQILDSNKYQAIARKQYEVRIVLPSTRGNIYDRQGSILVSNSMFFSYAADPKIVSDGANAVAQRFSRIFGKPEQIYLQKLESEKSALVERFSFNQKSSFDRSPNNDNEKENKNNRSTRRPVRSFSPRTFEEEKCLEIARYLEEADMSFMLSALKQHGLTRLESAYEKLKQMPSGTIQKKGAYFNSLLSIAGVSG